MRKRTRDHRGLTPREAAIIDAFGPGFRTANQVAEQLGIKPFSVSKTLNRLYSRFGVRCRAALLAKLAGDDTVPSFQRMLSARQEQALECVLRGESTAQMQETLGVGEYSVHGYLSGLFEHFKVSSRYELLAKAKEQGR
jgi:DNA-binding CsgD family transcriptional regulator